MAIKSVTVKCPYCGNELTQRLLPNYRVTDATEKALEKHRRKCSGIPLGTPRRLNEPILPGREVF